MFFQVGRFLLHSSPKGEENVKALDFLRKPEIASDVWGEIGFPKPDRFKIRQPSPKIFIELAKKCEML